MLSERATDDDQFVNDNGPGEPGDCAPPGSVPPGHCEVPGKPNAYECSKPPSPECVPSTTGVRDIYCCSE